MKMKNKLSQVIKFYVNGYCNDIFNIAMMTFREDYSNFNDLKYVKETKCE